jgi:hypothetical protein
MEEEWKDVEGYVGRYKVSNTGVLTGQGGRPRSINKNNIDLEGDYKVTLYEDGEELDLKVKVLFAYHFVENPHGYKYVHRISGDPWDFSPKHFEWKKRSPVLPYRLNKIYKRIFDFLEEHDPARIECFLGVKGVKRTYGMPLLRGPMRTEVYGNVLMTDQGVITNLDAKTRIMPYKCKTNGMMRFSPKKSFKARDTEAMSRVVAELFVPNSKLEEFDYAVHLDGNQQNNRADNLWWTNSKLLGELRKLRNQYLK